MGPCHFPFQWEGVRPHTADELQRRVWHCATVASVCGTVALCHRLCRHCQAILLDPPGKQNTTLPLADEAAEIAFTADGSQVLVADAAGRIVPFAVSSDRPEQPISSHRLLPVLRHPGPLGSAQYAKYPPGRREHQNLKRRSQRRNFLKPFKTRKRRSKPPRNRSPNSARLLDK